MSNDFSRPFHRPTKKMAGTCPEKDGWHLSREVFRRGPEGGWIFLEAGPGEHLTLDSLQVALSVDEVYLDPMLSVAPSLEPDTLRERRKVEAQRYTRRNILRSEFMYGPGFQSPGGEAAVEAFCKRLELRPGLPRRPFSPGCRGSRKRLRPGRSAFSRISPRMTTATSRTVGPRRCSSAALGSYAERSSWRTGTESVSHGASRGFHRWEG